MAMMSNAFDTCPTINVKLSIPESGYSFNDSLRLPVYLNRYIEKVEMPQANFTKNWQNISFN